MLDAVSADVQEVHPLIRSLTVLFDSESLVPVAGVGTENCSIGPDSCQNREKIFPGIFPLKSRA